MQCSDCHVQSKTRPPGCTHWVSRRCCWVAWRRPSLPAATPPKVCVLCIVYPGAVGFSCLEMLLLSEGVIWSFEGGLLSLLKSVSLV